MAWRKHLAYFVVCLTAFVLLCVVGGGMYEEAPSPAHPQGVIVFYHRDLPDPLGRLLWIGRFWLFVLTLGASAWFGYRFVRAWRAGPVKGFCPVCGYDLRASADTCPECGTAIAERLDAARKRDG
jgi:hypothetical protein